MEQQRNSLLVQRGRRERESRIKLWPHEKFYARQPRRSIWMTCRCSYSNRIGTNRAAPRAGRVRHHARVDRQRPSGAGILVGLGAGAQSAVADVEFVAETICGGRRTRVAGTIAQMAASIARIIKAVDAACGVGRLRCCHRSSEYCRGCKNCTNPSRSTARETASAGSSALPERREEEFIHWRARQARAETRPKSFLSSTHGQMSQLACGMISAKQITSHTSKIITHRNQRYRPEAQSYFPRIHT